MSELRPFPPSPRRLGLARQAGLHAASPVLVAGVATGGAALALGAFGAAAARRASGWVEAACRDAVDAAPAWSARAADAVTADARVLGLDAGERHETASAGATGVTNATGTSSPTTATAATTAAGSGATPGLTTVLVTPGGVMPAVIELAIPLLAAIALAALVAHLAQTRAPWLPRRRIRDAPVLPGGPGARVRHAALALAGAATVGSLVVAWLWLVAPRLAALPTLPLAGAGLVASAVATFAIAWVAVGVLDALLRHLELAGALRMTASERREDARAAGGDPRWRTLRRRLAAEASPQDAVAGATFLLLGDDTAVAVAWDALRRPVPMRMATGRGARATQLLALARRFRVPVHRDPHLASALVVGEGAVPEAHWPRVAELVAARPESR